MPKNTTVPSSPSHSSSSSWSSSSSSSSSGTTDHDGKRKTREMLRAELLEATAPPPPPPPPNNHTVTMIGASMKMQMGSRKFMDALSLGESILNNFRNRMFHTMNNLPVHKHNINPSPNFFIGESSRSNNNNNNYHFHENLNSCSRNPVEYHSQSQVVLSGGNISLQNINPPSAAAAAAVVPAKKKEDDGRMHSLPYEKYGPYTCPRCLQVFITSQSYASHASRHYKNETGAQRKKRLMFRPRVRNRNLCPQRVNNLITFVPVSSSASQAQPRSAPAPSAVKVEDRDHRQVPPPPAASASMVVEDDHNGVPPPPPPPPGFEAHNVRRAKATKIKSERRV